MWNQVIYLAWLYSIWKIISSSKILVLCVSFKNHKAKVNDISHFWKVVLKPQKFSKCFRNVEYGQGDLETHLENDLNVHICYEF